MTETVTEVSEEITVTSSGTPTSVSTSSPGSSITVAPSSSSSVTSIASDGSVAQLEVVDQPGPTTSVDTPSQVTVQATGTAPGAPGAPGEPGPAGIPDELIFTRIAAITLSGHRVVRPLPDGTVTYADSTRLVDATAALWLTLDAANAGDEINLVAIGNVTEPSWNWVPGEPIFLGPNGTLTQTSPLFGGDAFMVQVASPDTSIDVFYSPRAVTILGS